MRVCALKFLLFVGLLATPAIMCAQDLEYKMELGGALGGSFYLGDANFPGLFKGTSRLQLCKIGFDGPSPAYIVLTSADLLAVVVDDLSP